MISHFFIDRPIFASVISILITIAGGVSIFNLPIAQYPEIAPPSITVSATYPGANGELVAQNIGAVIEQQVNGADNMLYMQSTSSSTGSYTLTVYFEIGTDPDLAQVDVQNRVNAAMPLLPEMVSKQGVLVKKVSSTFMTIIALYSDGDMLNEDFVANYANIYVLDAIKRIPGANQSAILGMPDYAMRLWLKPDRMASLSLTASDIANAVSQQNNQFAVGRIGQAPTPRPVDQTFPVVTAGLMTQPAQFENIILRTDSAGTSIVRFKDVGRADLGRKDYSVRTRFDGKPATLIAIYQQPGANALDVSDQAKKTMEGLAKSFPQGLRYEVALDTTKFVRSSIDEVVHTFFEAVILVVLVVYIFLQSLRLTIIPTIAVPVSIIGTFCGMLLLGFSINMLTLFGMILAIGIVVDDAIVVIENTERNMTEFGLSPKDAAKRAMEEVTGPVVAIVLVLCSVFVPVAFLGGITGQLYKQFAVTVAISVVFSGIVALTLSPALAAILMKPGHGEKHGFFLWFENTFTKTTNGYVNKVGTLLKRPTLSLIVLAAICLAAGGFFKFIPGAFVPQEDQGYIFAPYFLPDAASLDRTSALGGRAADFMKTQPAVSNVTEFSGYSIIDGQTKTSAGLLFVALKDFEERTDKSTQLESLMMASHKEFSGYREGLVFPVNPPAVPGLGVTAGFEMWIQQMSGGNYSQLDQVVKKIVAKAKHRPELSGVSSTISANSRQYLVDVDRDKAETLGVPVQDIYNSLQTLFGSLYVNQFPQNSRLWQVILQAEPEYRMSPEDLQRIYVRNRSGDMVPVSAVVNARFVSGPDLVTRFNNYPAAKINGSPAPGYSTGQALAAIEEVAKEEMPAGFGYDWSGQAREEKKAGGTSSIAFIFGLIFVFLILAAQYESWSLPFSVMMAVPFAIFGALLAIFLRGIPNDVYFQIGLITLIALAAKNAILIIEFAVMKRAEGLSYAEAALEAAKLRLRPIAMTSFAFILGCVPLAIASGASANSRHSIGTGVIGGMLGATMIAIFFIPVFYVVLSTLSEKFFGRTKDAAPPTQPPQLEHKE